MTPADSFIIPLTAAWEKNFPPPKNNSPDKDR
jgi:hypothetical protein